MAKNNRNYKKNAKQNVRKQRTALAYQFGQIMEGLKNPDSAVSASFSAGEQSVKNQKNFKKKTLF